MHQYARINGHLGIQRITIYEAAIFIGVCTHNSWGCIRLQSLSADLTAEAFVNLAQQAAVAGQHTAGMADRDAIIAKLNNYMVVVTVSRVD